MPLTNETALRTTLNALFFRDNIVPKLRAIPELEIVAHLPMNDGETVEQYLDRVATWIGDHFGAYSIYHVNGRFKAGSLLTREQAAAREIRGKRKRTSDLWLFANGFWKMATRKSSRSSMSSRRSSTRRAVVSGAIAGMSSRAALTARRSR